MAAAVKERVVREEDETVDEVEVVPISNARAIVTYDCDVSE